MRTTVHVVAAALATGALASSAWAQGERAELAIPFKAATPATETGLDMDLRYLDPESRDEKPPTIRKLAIHLPAGTRIDSTAVPVCDASNEEIQARGRDACPPESLVGTGKLDVHLGGPGDPETTDLALFNGPGQIIEVLLFEGTNNTAALERLRIEGSTIAGEPVQVPPGAPPDRRFSASRIVWDIPARGGYLVTPPSCDGTWRTVGEFEFADDSTARAEFTQPCTAAEARPKAAAPRVDVTPRGVRRGRPTTLRITVRGCSGDAIAKVGRRAARIGEDGSATLVALVRWRRPVVQLRVATPCGRVRVPLRVRSGPNRPSSSGRAADRVRHPRATRR